MGGLPRHVHYVRAGDETLAIKTWSKVGTGAYSPQVRYLHRDHLGSVVAITTEAGVVESRSSFDAWGKRRDPATWVTPAAGTFTAAPTATDRGYTGHEHVDELGLVHMNGRIYDPEIGKFLSADPTLQFPESTQGYNRYAYAGNNPLSYTDPSGYSFWKKLMSFVGLIINFIPGFQGWSTAFWRGFVTGFLSSGGNLKAALLGGIGGQLFHQLGQSTLKFAARAIVSGLIGGALGAISGGGFKSGFLGAFSSALLLPVVDAFGEPGTLEPMMAAARIVTLAMVGGISSALGGGKFGNGAITAAFSAVFSRAVDVAYSDDGESTAEDDEGSRYAHDVYKDKSGGRLGEFGLENDRRGGFQAALYGGADGGPYYLAMAGTNPLSLADWGANAVQALGFRSSQYEKAVALAQSVAAKVGAGNLIIVGHSLGGGLASAAAIATGARAITFNAAGLNRIYRNGSAADIRAHYTRGDILNMVQRYTPLPNSVGVQVPHTPGWSKNPISRHGVF